MANAREAAWLDNAPRRAHLQDDHQEKYDYETQLGPRHAGCERYFHLLPRIDLRRQRRR